MDYRRQRELFDPEQTNPPVTIIGCGSLGSKIGVALAKLGLRNFLLYDHDHVEGHNIPNQAFYPSQVGMPKTDALRDLILDNNPNANVEFQAKFWDAGDLLLPGLLINAPDDIDVRKAVANEAGSEHFIIDVRSGRDSFNVLFCDKQKSEDWDYYSTTFFAPEEAAGTDCNALSTVYTSDLIAGIALQQFVQRVNNKPYHLRVDGCLHTLDMMFIR